MHTCQHCGCETTATGGKTRSREQLRRYFAMIRAAYTHWPESHTTQFSDAEDCRKWLQMSAGWREVGSRMRLTGVKPETAIVLAQSAIGGAGAYARAVVHKGELIVWRPISISFGKMTHSEFCRLNDEVASAIEAETGMKVDEMMRVAA